jgi:hypothetical protein
MAKGLTRAPTGDPPDHAEKGILHQVVEVGAGADEAPEQTTDRGLMAEDEFLECVPISGLRPAGQNLVDVGTFIRPGRAGGGMRKTGGCIFGLRFQSVVFNPGKRAPAT